MRKRHKRRLKTRAARRAATGEARIIKSTAVNGTGTAETEERGTAATGVAAPDTNDPGREDSGDRGTEHRHEAATTAPETPAGRPQVPTVQSFAEARRSAGARSFDDFTQPDWLHT